MGKPEPIPASNCTMDMLTISTFRQKDSINCMSQRCRDCVWEPKTLSNTRSQRPVLRTTKGSKKRLHSAQYTHTYTLCPIRAIITIICTICILYIVRETENYSNYNCIFNALRMQYYPCVGIISFMPVSDPRCLNIDGFHSGGTKVLHPSLERMVFAVKAWFRTQDMRRLRGDFEKSAALL